MTDMQYVNFYSTSNNQLSARFSGGVRFVTGGAGMTLDGQPVLAGSVAASQLTGTIADARLSTNVALLNGSANFNGTGKANNFPGNGAGLTLLKASRLTSGTLSFSRLPTGLVMNNQSGVTLNGTF